MTNKNFNPQEKILQYIQSSDKVTQIIGLFLRAKNVVPENQEQLNRIYNRHVRAAKELDCYSNKKIIKALKYLIDEANYKWTLESVIKCIDEDFEQLEGKEPIIKLKNGEQIYSVERIKQLEREGKIYYDSKGWCENPNK
jgi:hypothetical protein